MRIAAETKLETQPVHNCAASRHTPRGVGEGVGGINFLVIDVFVIVWSGYAAGFRSTPWRTSTSFHCAPVEGNSLQEPARSPPGKEKVPGGRCRVETLWNRLVLDVQLPRMECGALRGCRLRFASFCGLMR
jgi:hypothetical protein